MTTTVSVLEPRARRTSAPEASGAQTSADVAEAARVMAGLGLVTAFGHVSARRGDTVLITAAAELGEVEAGDVVEVPLHARRLPPEAPAEAWLHLAVYAARDDVAAIARAQPVETFTAAALGRDRFLPSHGQAAWLGDHVRVHNSALLARDAALADAAAADLGPSSHALLLRGNGAVTVGADPGLAVSRMWLLAATCHVWTSAPGATPLTAAEIAAWQRAQDELLPRLWRQLRRTAGVDRPNGEAR